MKQQAHHIILTFVLMYCMLLSFGTKAYATAGEIQPYYVGVSTITAVLKIDTGGKSTSSFTLVLKSDAVSSNLTIKLQSYRAGIWETVKSWSCSSGRTLTFEKDWYVQAGCSYRALVVADVYDANNTLIEHIEKTSSTVKY